MPLSLARSTSLSMLTTREHTMRVLATREHAHRCCQSLLSSAPGLYPVKMRRRKGGGGAEEAVEGRREGRGGGEEAVARQWRGCKRVVAEREMRRAWEEV